MIASTADTDFHSVVKSWLSLYGEILVVFRFPYGAGSKSFELFTDFNRFLARVAGLQAQTSVIVLKGTHLKLRGVVDDPFVIRALKEVADGEEWIMACLDQVTAGKHSWYHYGSGNTHAELERDLRDYFGQTVAVGIEPPYNSSIDPDLVAEAFTPNPDGSVKRAVY